MVPYIVDDVIANNALSKVGNFENHLVRFIGALGEEDIREEYNQVRALYFNTKELMAGNKKPSDVLDDIVITHLPRWKIRMHLFDVTPRVTSSLRKDNERLVAYDCSVGDFKCSFEYAIHTTQEFMVEVAKGHPYSYILTQELSLMKASMEAMLSGLEPNKQKCLEHQASFAKTVESITQKCEKEWLGLEQKSVLHTKNMIAQEKKDSQQKLKNDKQDIIKRKESEEEPFVMSMYATTVTVVLENDLNKRANLFVDISNKVEQFLYKEQEIGFLHDQIKIIDIEIAEIDVELTSIKKALKEWNTAFDNIEADINTLDTTWDKMMDLRADLKTVCV